MQTKEEIRVNERKFEELADHYGGAEKILWATNDGREMTLGSMALSHVENTIRYFQSAANRAKRLGETISEELEANPNSDGVGGFRRQLEECDMIVERGQWAVFVMKKERMRRRKTKGLRSDSKLDKMRSSLRRREVEHMRVVRA